jgi:3-methyladenine DNA glycosylase AlkD
MAATNAAASDQARTVIAMLERKGSKRTRDGMARYGLPSDNAFGVPVAAIKQMGKKLGRNHELACALWDSGVYEARMLASFVDEPERVTPTQMDRWCRDFDNWGICDTVCFHLFDRTPHAFRKIEQWAGKRGEFEKRAAFALLACVALHDKHARDDVFVRCLPLIEAAASDDRNLVKKAVSWALRAVGRRNDVLRIAAVDVAQRLAASTNSAERWAGKDALRDLRR